MYSRAWRCCTQEADFLSVCAVTALWSFSPGHENYVPQSSIKSNCFNWPCCLQNGCDKPETRTLTIETLRRILSTERPWLTVCLPHPPVDNQLDWGVKEGTRFSRICRVNERTVTRSSKHALMLHTHFHLNNSLLRSTNGRSLGSCKQNNAFFEGCLTVHIYHEIKWNANLMQQCNLLKFP